MELTKEDDFDIRQSDEGVGMMVLECGCEYFEPKSKLTQEEATEILKKLRDKILENQEDAKKFREIVGQAGKPLTTTEEIWEWRKDAKAYNSLMKANSEVVKHNINITKEHQIVEQLKKLDIVTKIGFAYLMCNRDHPETRDVLEKLGNELQKILESDKDVHKYEDCPDPYKCDIHIGIGGNNGTN